jgi:hypothetical protein
MERDERIRTLEDWRVDLSDAEKRFAAAEREVRYLRQIVEGMEGLAGGDSTPTARSRADKSPRGATALRELLPEMPQEVTWPMIFAELRNRGWMNLEARQPEAATRAAMDRLIDFGEVQRVRKGVFRYLGPNTGTTGPAMSVNGGLLGEG